VLSADANVVAYVESLWPNFICNLMLVENKWLTANFSLAKKLVETAARSGLWAKHHPKQAAQIASRYWNQPIELVHHALTVPLDRVRYDRFVPKVDELQVIADLMVRFDLIDHADIHGLVDDRFALAANIGGIDDLNSICLP
jgi:NitT/TauT family transport system substrate-binding protein